MRYYAITLWWMLPILQIRRHGIDTSFALSHNFGTLYLCLGCFPLDNSTWLLPSDCWKVLRFVILSYTTVGRL